MPSDFLTLADLGAEEIRAVLKLAADLKQRQKSGELYRPLDGKSVALLFEKPSLRTRTTFELGIVQLGGYGIVYETRLGERESVPDVARNLERWVDGIMARTFEHRTLEILAEYAKVPVINGLSDDFHPCQILAASQTLLEHKGVLDGLKVAFVGDGNNVFASWAMLATRIPIELTLVCPEGYEPSASMTEAIQAAGGLNYSVTHDPAEGTADADAVYTDVWASMGQEDEEERRAAVFAPYQVNEALMAHAKPDALFMHCLPAHRGQEVTDGVIESAQSVVFDEAENRLHAQKAVMLSLMGGTEH